MSFCYINGFYKNNIDAQISVEDRGFNFSDGVYEVMGFRNGKLLNFDNAVNVTIGLPINRVSPDHGPAYDIAFTNKSNHTSMLNAINYLIKYH